MKSVKELIMFCASHKACLYQKAAIKHFSYIAACAVFSYLAFFLVQTYLFLL